MKLVVTEKNDAATKIAALLGVKKPKADKVYSTPVYRFEVDGEEWVTIGLRGHILEPDFTPTLIYKKRGGWRGVTAEGEAIPAQLPASLARPPFKKKKPFIEDGVELKAWKMDALPYLIYAPIEKLPKEKEIIRSLKNLAKKADSIVIATDFDREGELIGSDALSCIQEVNPTAPVSRARYSAFTKEEITHAFSNLVELDTNLASAGASRQDIDLIWGAVLTRYLTLVKFAGYGNVRSSGRVQTPTLALIVARERERLAFIPEDYWVIKGAFDAGADRRSDRRRRRACLHGAALHGPLQGRGGGEGGHGRRFRRGKRHGGGGGEAHAQAATARAVQHHQPHGRGIGGGPFAGAHHAHRRKPVHGRLYLLSACRQHGVSQLARPGRSGEDHLGQPGVRPVLPAAALRRRAARHARQEGDHRPSAHLSHGQGHARRPGTGRLQAVQPHRTPIPGNAVGCGRGRGHEGHARSERRAFRGQGRRAGDAGLSRHLPVRHEEGRAAARHERGTADRLQRRRVHEEADRAAGALQPGQADPGDGEAGPGHEVHAPQHHRAPVHGEVHPERPHRAQPAGHGGLRRA